jgi:hypothetical protein
MRALFRVIALPVVIAFNSARFAAISSSLAAVGVVEQFAQCQYCEGLRLVHAWIVLRPACRMVDGGRVRVTARLTDRLRLRGEASPCA